MTLRAEFWYVFGVAAVALLALRLRHTRLRDMADPLALTFTLCLFLPAFGTLSRQPPIAGFYDGLFGVNAAWLIADIFFIAGVCAGTYWIDLLSRPELRSQGLELLRRWRFGLLVAVSLWMVSMALLDNAVWTGLERGTIDTGGSVLILSARLAYFIYSAWGIIYLSHGFYRHRQRMQDRVLYIRMTIPWIAITLAPLASLMQAAAVVEVFLRPDLLSTIWPRVWQVVTGIQMVVAVLMVATFLPFAWRSVVWLDKQLLIRRLLFLRGHIKATRPDLVLDEPPLGAPGWIIRNPDLWLTSLVSELELTKQIISKPQYEVTAPAGGVMPQAAKLALREEQVNFFLGLSSRKQVSVPRVTGNFYSLARWYAGLRPAL